MKRAIDSELWEDEEFGTLPPMAKLLALGIMTHVDDNGEMSANPKLITSRLFMYDSLNIDGVNLLLESLQSAGMISLFGDSGKRRLVLNRKWLGKRVGATEQDEYGPGWKRLSNEAKQRDGNKCVNCGRSNCRLAAHHIVPLGSGGTNTLSNLVTLCSSCHRKAHRKQGA